MSAPSSIQIPTLLSQLGVAQGRWYRPAAPKKNVAVMTSPGELPFEDISAHRAPTLTTLHGAWWSPCIGRGDLGSWLWLLPWRPGPAWVGRAAEAQRKTREGQVDSPPSCFRGPVKPACPLSAPPSESQPPLWFLLSQVSRPQLQAPGPPGRAHSRASSRRPRSQRPGPRCSYSNGRCSESTSESSPLFSHVSHTR